MPYPTDLRECILKYVENSGSKDDVVTIFSVCVNTIWNSPQKNKQGNLTPKVKKVRPRKIDDSRLKKHIENPPNVHLR